MSLPLCVHQLFRAFKVFRLVFIFASKLNAYLCCLCHECLKYNKQIIIKNLVIVHFKNMHGAVTYAWQTRSWPSMLPSQNQPAAVRNVRETFVCAKRGQFVPSCSSLFLLLIMHVRVHVYVHVHTWMHGYLLVLEALTPSETGVACSCWLPDVSNCKRSLCF